jgi:hypothetical protein
MASPTSKKFLETQSTAIAHVMSQNKLKFYHPLHTSTIDLPYNATDSATDVKLCPTVYEHDSLLQETSFISRFATAPSQPNDEMLAIKAPASTIRVPFSTMNLSLLLEDSEPLFLETPSSESSCSQVVRSDTARHTLLSDEHKVPQNCLTLDHGLTYVKFTREEDRSILLEALHHGDAPNVWSSLIASGAISSDKSVAHITARYRQLCSMIADSGPTRIKPIT